MELKLLKDLTRNGIVLPKGTTVEVHERKVEWFIKNGIAEKVTIVIPTSAPSDEESHPTQDKPSRKKRGKRS